LTKTFAVRPLGTRKPTAGRFLPERIDMRCYWRPSREEAEIIEAREFRDVDTVFDGRLPPDRHGVWLTTTSEHRLGKGTLKNADSSAKRAES
jgi:hypothetical protein